MKKNIVRAILSLLFALSTAMVPLTATLAQGVGGSAVNSAKNAVSNTAAGTQQNKDLSIVGQLKEAGGQAFNTQNVRTPAQIVGQVIQIVLSFLGIAATGLVIYGGFLWLTARGNDEAVKKARSIIVNAIIGLIIIMSAYAITNFVVTQLQQTTQIGG